MRAIARACWLLLALASVGRTAHAAMVTRRLGTPPTGAPGEVEAAPAPPPVAYVPRATAAPRVDGELGEAAWQETEPLGLSTTVDGSGPAAQPAELRLLRDDEALYVALRCVEPALDRLRAARRPHDGEVWLDDSVEVFLGVAGAGGYFHFGVNCNGSTYDAEARDPAWNSGFEAAVGRQTNAWTVELSIPLAKLAGEGKLPAEWIASFNRNRYVTGAFQESAWSPTYSGDSHVPERFGRLLFREPPAGQAARRPDARPGEGQPTRQEAQVLPCRGGEGVVRFDLSWLPPGTRVYRADLRIFRTGESTGRDDEALVDIEIHPLLQEFAAGGAPTPKGGPLALRGPWYDRFDATEAVRAWVGGRPNGGFFVKTCPRWDRPATCLEVAYEGQPQDVPPQVKGLKAFHRSGQTFITWREIEDLVGRDEAAWRELKSVLDDMDRQREVRYCVYRSRRPITTKTLPNAELIARVKPLSCWNTNGRNIERPIDHVIAEQEVMVHGHGNPFGTAEVDGPFGLDCPIDRLVIREGAEPLPRATGLYVHTAVEKTRAYYAVVTCVDGRQNTAAFSPANSLERPVNEAPAEPEPVLQGELSPGPLWRYPGKRLHYVRWVGPAYGNLPQQYYNWSVALPQNLAADAPLELNLHRDRGSYWRTQYRLERDSIVLSPHDFPLRTWWYGYHESQGTLRSFAQGTIHNYTERRLLSFLDWAAREWPVDRDRIIVTGVAWSGGSGALHLGLRHPEVFSAIVSGHGIPDYGRALADTRGTRRAGMMEQLERLWGKLDWNLKTDGGQSVWDELNLTKTVADLPAKADLPLLAITAQHYIAWGLWPSWHDLLNVMLAKRHAILAEFQWGGGKLLPVSATGTWPNVIRLDVRRDRSMLAFKGPGTNVLETAGGMGLFNLGFRWRGDDIVDQPDRYEATIFWAGKGSSAQGDVSLRRLQNFRVVPGETYAWLNRTLDGTTVLQQGRAVVGEDGVLTIEDVSVANAGSRLVVTRGQ
ncbi:MAG: sugar-binding protein [Armatimonadota bacterium]